MIEWKEDGTAEAFGLFRLSVEPWHRFSFNEVSGYCWRVDLVGVLFDLYAVASGEFEPLTEKEARSACENALKDILRGLAAGLEWANG